jgi:ATP-binding cassette subfamily F protein 3
MIVVQDAGIRFGTKTLFEGVSFGIRTGEKVALVGRNGVGKSTVLKGMAGLLEWDKGAIHLPKGASVSYLSQDPFAFASKDTLEEEMRKASRDVLDLERELHDAQRDMERLKEDPIRLEEIIERYSVIESRFREARGYSVESRIGKILSGLGFGRSDWNRKIHEFSGGWQMRAAMAALLVSEPDVLLLDEPTNNLDMEAIEWLEDYLKGSPSTVLVVSHDRYLLDKIVTRVLELEFGGIEEYHTDYSGYIREKAERLEQAMKAYQAQQEEIQRIQAFIDKNIANPKTTKRAQSRQKVLEKMERLPMPRSSKSIRFHIKEARRPPKIAVRTADLRKSFGTLDVLEGVDLTVHRGARIAILGPNGSGKSTLLKILTGTLEPSSGEVFVAETLRIGYFAQSSEEALDPDLTVLETMERAAEDFTELELRTLLGAFHFSDDDVFKTVSVLSGGERTRLCLALVFAKPRNFLLLDEPTNHLDIPSREALEEALGEFEGPLVFISHDRYFIEKLADTLLIIDSRGMRTFQGHFSEYEEERRVERSERKRASPGRRAKERRKEEKLRTIEWSRKKREAKDHLADIESRITELEDRQRDLESIMTGDDFYDDPEHVKKVINEYNETKPRLTRLYEEWEIAASTLERIVAERQGQTDDKGKKRRN